MGLPHRVARSRSTASPCPSPHAGSIDAAATTMEVVREAHASRARPCPSNKSGRLSKHRRALRAPFERNKHDINWDTSGSGQPRLGRAKPTTATER